MSEKRKIYHPENDPEKGENNLLQNMGRDNPFTVPEGYFDQLTNKIMDRISDEKKQQSHSAFQMFHKSGWIPAMAAAAGVILIVALTIFLPQKKADQDLIPQVTLNQLLDEKPEYIEDMDEWTLIETLNDNNDLSFYDSNTDQSIEFDSTISNENIIEYMEYEDFDSDLYNNL